MFASKTTGMLHRQHTFYDRFVTLSKFLTISRPAYNCLNIHLYHQYI